MAERFPKRSVFSAISSSKSGSPSPPSGKPSQSGNSDRRRPPELPRPNSEIRDREVPSALPPKSPNRTRIRAAADAVPPPPIDSEDFLSNPKSAISRRNPNVRKLPRSSDRNWRNTKLGQVDLFDPRSNQETASPEPSSTTLGRETKLSGSELPITPAPRPRSRLSSPSLRDRDAEKPSNIKTQPVPKPSPQADKKPDKKPSKKQGKKPAPQSAPPLVYATRLLILGVGIAVISGTVLSVANAWNRSTVVAQEQSIAAGENKTPSAPATPAATEALQLDREISALKTPIQILATENPNLTAGIFLVDLDTGSYLNFNGDVTFAAASTIKVPILIAFFQAVDEGRVQLDQMLTLQQEHIVGGSGELQDQPPGTKYSALEVAKK